MRTWLNEHQTITSSLAAAIFGAVGWSGHVVALPLSFAFLLIVLLQPSRSATYGVAFIYYAGSTWPIMPGSNTFFGPNSQLWQGVMLWLTASALLATPWALFHFRTWPARFWSAPLALAATGLPPLGIIGYASPLTSAGVLFPGTAWIGLIAVLLLPAVIVRHPPLGLGLAGALFAFAHSIYPGDPLPPPAWEAADTKFGRGELRLADPIREFQNVEWIQRHALSSNAKVIVFPETVVPRWNEAAEAFWEPNLAILATRDKTIVFGTTIPVAATKRRLNTVVIRGASTPASMCQRIPAPISMWKPFSESGFPLRLTGPGTVQIAGERAGVLICYELLLTWPILSASLERPSILVGVANDYWASQTPIPAVQREALTAWARLFSLPRLIAVNT